MLSLSHLLLVLLIVLLVFGAGRLPRVMNDIGKGVRSLREGLKSEEEQEREKSARPPSGPVIENEPVRMQEKDKDKVG